MTDADSIEQTQSMPERYLVLKKRRHNNNHVYHNNNSADQQMMAVRRVTGASTVESTL